MTKPVASFDAYTFECARCGRIEKRPARILPEGWQMADEHRTHCEDCAGPPIVIGVIPTAEELEGDPGQHLAWMGADRDTRVNVTPQADKLGQFGSYSIAERVNAPDPAFGYGLHRDPDGTYKVALQPWRAMTIWHPMLAFLLPPDEADKVADELKRYAALARNPGTMGAAA